MRLLLFLFGLGGFAALGNSWLSASAQLASSPLFCKIWMLLGSDNGNEVRVFLGCCC